MSEIRQLLNDKILELEQIRKIKLHIVQLKERLTDEEKALEVMGIMLDKEQRDVELLEKEGFQSMWHKFIGDREEKLEKEKEEYVRAALRFNVLFKSVELGKFELGLLEKKDQNDDAIKQQVDELIKKRGDELLQLDPVHGNQLRIIYNEKDRLNKLSSNIEIAYEAGQLAYGHVRRIESYIHAAKDSRMWHQTLYHARDMSVKARHIIIYFINELSQVYDTKPYQFDLKIEDDNDFSMLFPTSIMLGWRYDQSIKKSLQNIRETRFEIQNVLDKLEQEKIIVRENLKELDEKYRNVILDSLKT
jgi:hypothetical protein